MIIKNRNINNKDYLYNEYINKNKTIKQISKEMGYDHRAVSKRLHKYEIPIKKDYKSIYNERFKFSKAEIDFIDGCLLGDGFIERGSDNSAFFSYTAKHKEHVFYVYKNLKKYASKKYISGPVYSEYFDKRTLKTYSKWRFRTRSNFSFSEIHKRWYKKQKIIPLDLKLNPVNCLLWYIGDGNLNPSDGITLATNCFTRDEVIYLKDQLSNFHAHEKQEYQKNKYLIYIPKRGASDFLDYIGDPGLQCYSYKWELKNGPTLSEFNKAKRKPIVQKTLGGEIVKTWESQVAAREDGFCNIAISSVCNGNNVTHKGFKWSFVDS